MRLALLLMLAGCQVLFAPDVGDAAGDDVGDDGVPIPDAAVGGFNTPVPVDVAITVTAGGWVADPALTADEGQLAFLLYSPTGGDIRVAHDRVSATVFAASDVPGIILIDRFESVPELSAGGERLYYATAAGTTDPTDIAVAVRSTPTATDWQIDPDEPGLSTPDKFDAPGGPTADGVHMIVRRSTTRGDAALVELEWTAKPPHWFEVAGTTALLNTHVRPNNAQLSPDGLRVAFSSYQTGSSDLYVATRPALGEPFADIEPIEALNTADYNESDPWLSADGNRIYFSRSTVDGIPTPEWGIWFSERTAP